MKQVWILGHKVDWQRCEVTTTESIFSVEPRVLDVLQALVAANGEVVSHQQLLSAVWGEAIVAPNALQRCIAQLRKIFGDDAKQQVLIKTHPKRGYSLAASVITEQPDQAVAQPIGLPPRLKFICAVVILIVTVIVTSKLWRQQPNIHYNQIVPLTSSDQVERHPALSSDFNLLAFISADNVTNAEQLMVKDLATGQLTSLLSTWRLRGAVAFSPDNTSLAYAELIIKQGRKCSQLMAIALDSKITTVLQTCRDDFLSDPIWLNTEQLLYVQTSKAGIQQLKILELASGISRPVKTSSQSLIALSYHRATQQLALLSQASNKQLHLAVATLDLAASTIDISASWPVNLPWRDDLKPQWFNDQQIVLASDKSLYWYSLQGQLATTALLSNDSIYSAIPYRDNQLIAVMGQQDWDVRQTSWHDNQTTTVARSISGEHQAQYLAQQQGISFISHRAGRAQIWLNSNQQTQQISHSESDVTSYIWSPTAQQVAFISNDQLWLQPLKQPAQHLSLDYKVASIYQWRVNDHGADSLLLSVVINDEPRVISLNLTNLEHITEFVGPSEWAQKVAQDTLIVNDYRGQLLKQTPQGRLAIPALSKLTLHWRYLWRDNWLYFQDKQKNIWRYQPVSEQAEIIGQYDENSIFITDVNPEQQSMLTENFVGQHQDIFVFR